jgi:hypothetical protein
MSSYSYSSFWGWGCHGGDGADVPLQRRDYGRGTSLTWPELAWGIANDEGSWAFPTVIGLLGPNGWDDGWRRAPPSARFRIERSG